jgi:hypothetical protein
MEQDRRKTNITASIAFVESSKVASIPGFQEVFNNHTVDSRLPNI